MVDPENWTGALAQAMDQVLGAGNLKAPEAEFLFSIREGFQPTLESHAKRFGCSISSLHRRRSKVIAKVGETARALLARWEECPAHSPMLA